MMTFCLLSKRKLIRIIQLSLIILVIALLFYMFHYHKSIPSDYTKEIHSTTSFLEMTVINLQLSFEEIQEINNTIYKINKEEVVFNKNQFGPLNSNDFVIIVQVHDRLNYLKQLVGSLERAKGIENVLLIFSHDVYHQQINQFIKTIHFCKVIQIFYPHSLQLHPNSFPGQSVNDCDRNLKKEDAISQGCVNAEWPDKYGHYREAKYTQTKHHWWWKVNHVVDQMTITRKHSGYFMFLEEDHYVVPDIFHVLNKMIQFKEKDCKSCDMVTLGIYPKSVDFNKNGNKIEMSKWISSRHNMGFAIDRSVWNLIKSCAEQFCSYDDYNWDWSLQFISDKCFQAPLITFVASSPRVFHIGECGVHHKGKLCDVLITKVKKIISDSVNELFPAKLIMQKGSGKKLIRAKVNGGWGDRRDHQLCLKQVKHTENTKLI